MYTALFQGQFHILCILLHDLLSKRMSHLEYPFHHIENKVKVVTGKIQLYTHIYTLTSMIKIINS